MDWNILTIIVSIGILMWWLIKPIRESLFNQEKEINEIRKDVKQNSERIAKIEGVIWTDINKAIKKGK